MKRNYFTPFFAALSLFAFIFVSTAADAQPYRRRSLEARVAELERMVEQMQMHIDQLADRITSMGPQVPMWTCRITAWGRPYSASAPTRGQAKAMVLKECGARTNSMHCREADVICDR